MNRLKKGARKQNKDDTELSRAAAWERWVQVGSIDHGKKGCGMWECEQRRGGRGKIGCEKENVPYECGSWRMYAYQLLGSTVGGTS
jgi:hypothetical protein